jgi:cytidyltransferase-like protein
VSFVIVVGAFDDLGSPDLRFLQEASRDGPLRVLVWSDAAVLWQTGSAPVFPEQERLYLAQSIRWVAEAYLADAGTGGLPDEKWLSGVAAWAFRENDVSDAALSFCARHDIKPILVPELALAGFPKIEPYPDSQTQSVVVTGCYDKLHSGHVRFFEESSAYGRLYVGVGSDATIRGLKGAGHPMLPEAERLYDVACVRFVHEAFISSGSGWLDAAPDIERIQPDFYVVNDDGDRAEKRAFCKDRGIEYVVLKREPKAGLPRRSSTELRGF